MNAGPSSGYTFSRPDMYIDASVPPAATLPGPPLATCHFWTWVEVDPIQALYHVWSRV